MEPTHTINRIIAAKVLSDVLNINNVKDEYREISKLIHPDKCTLTNASNAFAKLNELKDAFEKGKDFIDDAGKVTTNQYWIRFSGDPKLLHTSLQNYRALKSLKDTASLHFHKYLPDNLRFEGNELVAEFYSRSVPLSGMQVEQVHVNWIVSRMLEFSAWLSQHGFVHCGLNPESVFIIPENHGIQVVSFYHMKPIYHKLETVSAKYKNWYPDMVFNEKMALPIIDIELCKRTGAYLLGDRSGSGVMLKRNKAVNSDYVNFLLGYSNDVVSTWKKYREMIDKNFEKKFYLIDV